MLAFALLWIVPCLAIADTITKFHETWSDLGVITNDDDHYAGIVVQDTLKDKLAAPFQFNNGSEWDKFVELWTKAKAMPEGSSDVVGRLKDSAGDSLIVVMDGDGHVEISVAEPAQPGRYELFCDFHLQKEDVAAFDKRVREVSVFFQ
jgi:hypothetical protein